jgi:hypothetical protein
MILSEESKQSRVLFALNHRARDMGFWQRVMMITLITLFINMIIARSIQLTLLPNG